MRKLNLNLRRSWYLTGFLIVTHGGALVILPFLSIPLGFCAFLSLLTIASFVSTWQKHAWRFSEKAIVYLQSAMENQWFLTCRSGAVIQARLCGDSVVTPAVAVLHFKVQYPQNIVQRLQIIPVIICKDTLHKDEFRRLRVWLFVEKIKLGKNTIK